MRTKKIVAKRFRVTKTGLILRRKQMGRHLRRRKSKRQLRSYKKLVKVTKSMKRTIRAFLPYA